jgi:antitoxin (DNA-binding transcriptional repressor) of toxin-antitoxin stability system
MKAAEAARPKTDRHKRVALRSFRANISKELESVRASHDRLVISKNNIDIAGLVPMSIMSLIDKISRKVDLDELLHKVSDPEKALDTLVAALSTETIDSILLRDYPPEYFSELSSARELWITGSNNRRIFPHHLGILRKILEKGGTVAVLFVDPTSDAIRYSAMQEMGFFDGELPKSSQRKTIEDAKQSLLELADDVKKGSIEIYKMDYPPTFGMDIVDKDGENTIAYIRYYPFADFGQPIIKLTRSNNAWLNFYIHQLERFKTAAQPWKPWKLERITSA